MAPSGMLAMTRANETHCGPITCALALASIDNWNERSDKSTPRSSATQRDRVTICLHHAAYDFDYLPDNFIAYCKKGPDFNSRETRRKLSINNFVLVNDGIM